MTSNFHFTFPIDQLAEAIVEKLNPNVLPKPKESIIEDILLTRKETSKRLNISLPTLNVYTKKGILKGYRIGSRVLYKNSEVENALSAIIFSKI